jgi:dTDP-4-dehydrorhamnose reductase
VRVLVLGATGMLGSDMVKVLRERGHKVTAFGSSDLDLTDERAVRETPILSRKNQEWIINCAAYTKVDKAEEEPELARDINEEAVFNLSARLERGPRLLHFSTDFVFDGTKGSPYLETDEVEPLGEYGKSKLAGERYAEAMTEDALIFRTSWLYGAKGNSFPKTMIMAHDLGKTLRVVNDQIGCPTYTMDFAVASAEAIEKHLPCGIYHASGRDVMTWQEFAKATLLAWTGSSVAIEGIATSEYPTLAQRPSYSALDTSKLSEKGISPWRSTAECLDDFCQQIRLATPAAK